MVFLLVLLTFVIGASINYYVQRKKGGDSTAQWRKDNLSPSVIGQMLPAGIFLQSSLTWSKILDSGNLMIGIQPILMGLIGKAYEIETLSQEGLVKKGDVLLQIRKGKKVIKVKSPVQGKIVDLNTPALDEPNWKIFSQNWLYSIEAENVGDEISSWLVAERSRAWINKTYQQIKNFLIQTLPQTQIGLTMADGGDIPVGILSQFDEKTWTAFENEFINKKRSEVRL